MQEEQRIYRGDWWRFDRYELRDGYIRPAPGAGGIHYDPWPLYDRTRDMWSPRDIPPHKEFLRVVSAFKGDQDSGEAERQLLGWCARFGLLGIGLQTYLQIEPAPRWTAHHRPCPARDVYFRTGLGWYVDRHIDLSQWGAATGAELAGAISREPGALVPPDQWDKSWFGPRALAVGDYDEACPDTPRPPGYKPLGESWGHFFPSVPPSMRDGFDYPVPTSEEFWCLYAEPVSDILAFGRRLRSTLDLLSAPHSRDADPVGGANEGGMTTRKDRLVSERVAQGFRSFDRLLEGATPILASWEDGVCVPAWRCQSLAQTLAMMFYRDLTEKGGRVTRCRSATCGTPFVAHTYQEAYCSVTCRNRENKRNYRSRVEAKKT